jgi:DNA-binding SARP family transcriptional activator/tetratricopeptide (TPR) repeat protein
MSWTSARVLDAPNPRRIEIEDGAPVAPPPGGGAEVRLLGTPSLRIGAEEHPLPRKAFVMLAVLALSPAHTASRARLRGILWGNNGHANAGANLRQLLTRVHRVERATGCKLIQLEGDGVRLARDGLLVDLVAYAAPGARTVAGDAQGLLALVRSYAGELLCDLHPDDDALDEWLSRERANMKASFVTAAVTFLQSGAGTPAEDLEVAGRLLAVDPTHEAAYRARIRAYGVKGDITRCRAAYLECERVLKAELGVQPSVETQAVAGRYFDTGLGRPLVEPPVRASATPATVAPDGGRPRVVLLPPVDPFDDAKLRRLATFVLEDLTIGLSRYRSFRVIAAHSALAMAAGHTGRQVARDWCDWVLASTLCAAGKDHELKFRLTDARSGEVAWSSSMRFDGKDLPALFQDLADRAVVALADTVEQRETERPVAAENPSAYRLYLEGRRWAGSTQLQELRRARRLFREAAQRDPTFAAARAGLARTRTMEWIVRADPDPQHLLEAVGYADRAIEIDHRDARGYREKAYALLYMKRHDESLALFSEAAAHNPNDADLLADYADALGHAGDPETGLTVLDRALMLNPAIPTFYRWVQGSLRYQMGHYHDAIAILEAGRPDPALARLLAACHAQVGNMAAARVFVRLARENHPDFTVDRLVAIVPDRNPEDTRHLAEGLRRAGLS